MAHSNGTKGTDTVSVPAKSPPPKVAKKPSSDCNVKKFFNLELDEGQEEEEDEIPLDGRRKRKQVATDAPSRGHLGEAILEDVSVIKIEQHRCSKVEPWPCYPTVRLELQGGRHLQMSSLIPLIRPRCQWIADVRGRVKRTRRPKCLYPSRQAGVAEDAHWGSHVDPRVYDLAGKYELLLRIF